MVFRCSTIASRPAYLLAVTLFLFSISLKAAECESGKGITSNDVIGLAGRGDTLWMATFQEPARYALNTLWGNGALSDQVTTDSKWLSYSLGCKNYYVQNMALGDGALVVSFDTLRWREPNPLLLFKRVGELVQSQSVFFDWPQSLLLDTLAFMDVQGAVWVNGSFYFACTDGGVVKWEPQIDEKTVFVPGSIAGVALQGLEPPSGNFPDTLKRVIGVEQALSSVVVTTPSRIWRFTTEDQVWDSSLTSVISDSDYTFKRFEKAFARDDSTGVLYSLIAARKKGSKTDTLLFCKYNEQVQKWGCMLEQAPRALSFAPGGYMYMVFGKNTVRVYRDTLGSSGVKRNPVPVVDRSKFEPRLTPPHYGIDFPEYINDIMYIAKTDSSGYLWVASSEGLFLSEDEVPGKSSQDFMLVKRAPKVQAGLRQTYARPGILISDSWGTQESRSVFIYNLQKDARVTIKVYDFNMDLVKTIVDGKPRKAGKNGGPRGRSTVENEDHWDGRNLNGKMVAPGVYYYKITTDTGERAFGKLVVAKGK